MTSRAPDVEGLTLLSVVARTGSLGAAARTMGLAQPNASRMLARLERDLGLSLVDRSPSGSRLTPHGRLVVDWAEPVLTALDRLAAGAESLREDRASHLVVGASLTVGEHLVPRWLTRFRSEHPEVQVRIRVMNSADVVAAVESRTIDVGFVESPTVPSSLQSLVVGHDELVVVVAPDHPWTHRTQVSVDDLAATPLVVREPGSGTRDTVDEGRAEFPASCSRLRWTCRFRVDRGQPRDVRREPCSSRMRRAWPESFPTNDRCPM